jgi:hypothetical protein
MDFCRCRWCRRLRTAPRLSLRIVHRIDLLGLADALLAATLRV